MSSRPSGFSIVPPPTPVLSAPGLTQETVRALCQLVGLTVQDPLRSVGEVVGDLFAAGPVMAIIPPEVRMPTRTAKGAAGICPWTGLSFDELHTLRTVGYRTAPGPEGVELVPPFKGWWVTSPASQSRGQVHVRLPELLAYLQQVTTAFHAYRASVRASA